MASAQDKALASLCLERGLLDEAAVERARAAHSQAARRPLGQVLVDGGFVESRVAADLLRELVLSTFHCPTCSRSWSYEALAELQRYRCDRCGERLDRKRPRGASGSLPPPHAIKPVRPDATEALSRGPARGITGSSASKVALSPMSPALAESGPPAPPRPAPPPQTRSLGPYEIVSEIGRGAMGVVYLARRAGLERQFALKVMLGSKLADGEAIERFRREAALASRLQDPSIISVTDVGQAGEYYYYAMDYCPGRTLQAVLQEGKKDPTEAARLMAQLARGAQVAHAQGIVHRDLKPANVILDEKTGIPRITDFGLARDASSVLAGMTRTGDVLGTPYYMSPEQFRGERDIDARSDVYALGVTLFELLSGRKPFVAETAALVASHVLTEDPPLVRELEPSVPAPLEAITAKALAREKNARYRNAGGLAKDLERFLAGEPVFARPEGFLERAARRARRLARPTTVVIAALVLLIVSLVAVIARSQSTEHQRILESDEEKAALKVFLASVVNLNETAKRGLAIEDLEKEREKLAREVPPGRLVARDGAPVLDLTWAQVLHRRARFGEAAELASKLEGNAAVAPLARRIRADALLARGRTKEAQDLLRELESSPDPQVSSYARVRLAADSKKALSLARELKLSESSDGPSLSLVARLVFQDGYFEDDEKRAESVKEARAALDRALGLALDDAPARLLRAVLARPPLGTSGVRGAGARSADKGRREDLDAFEKLAGKEAESEPDFLRERALQDLAGSRYAEMIGRLDAALALRPGDFELDVARGWFADEVGSACRARAASRDEMRFHEAAAMLPLPAVREIAAMVTSSAETRIRAVSARAALPARGPLARALLASANAQATDSVRDMFLEAREASPTCSIVATEHARFLLSRGEHKGALDEVARARALGAPVAVVDRIELEACERSGRRSAASRVLDRIREKDAQSASVLASAWDLAARAGTPTKEEAARLVHEASANAPRDASAHRLLAVALLRHSVSADADRSLPDYAEDAAWRAIQLEGLLDVEPYAVVVFAREVRFSFDAVREGSRGGEFRHFRERLQENAEAHTDLAALSRAARQLIQEADNRLLAKRIAPWPYENLLGGDAITEDRYKKALEVEPDAPLAEEALGFFYLSVPGEAKRAASHWKKAQKLDSTWRLPPHMLPLVRERSAELAERFGRN
ncbi:protein kinase [bacterium]|nr:protein kinase [bacterium]